MSWLYSRVLVEEYLGENFSDGEQSAPLNGNHIQQAYCAPDKMTDFSRLSRFGMTFKPLTVNLGEELLMSYLAGFHARTSQLPEKEMASTVKDQECGAKWLGSFVKFDRNSSLWKTHQCSLLGDLEPFLETWPRWGLMRDGECWEQTTLEQTIRGTESGLLPTPTVTTAKQVAKSMNSLGKPLLHMAALTWPTPCASDWKGSGKSGTLRDRLDYAAERGATKSNQYAEVPENGGKLSPTWVEWLMGWPLGWTDLKPLETDKCHSAPQQLGEY